MAISNMLGACSTVQAESDICPIVPAWSKEDQAALLAEIEVNKLELLPQTWRALNELKVMRLEARECQ